MNTPLELKYTKDHEWVKIEGDIATISGGKQGGSAGAAGVYHLPGHQPVT